MKRPVDFVVAVVCFFSLFVVFSAMGYDIGYHHAQAKCKPPIKMEIKPMSIPVTKAEKASFIKYYRRGT